MNEISNIINLSSKLYPSTRALSLEFQLRFHRAWHLSEVYLLDISWCNRFLPMLGLLIKRPMFHILMWNILHLRSLSWKDVRNPPRDSSCIAWTLMPEVLCTFMQLCLAWVGNAQFSFRIVNESWYSLEWYQKHFAWFQQAQQPTPISHNLIHSLKHRHPYSNFPIYFIQVPQHFRIQANQYEILSYLTYLIFEHM